MNKWLNLIGQHEEEIINAGIEAYKESIENPHLRYIVEMNEDGEVHYWYDIAGGNSFHMSTYQGKAIELIHLCMRDMEFDPTDETVEQKLKAKGLWNLYLDERERQDVEDYDGAEIVLCNAYDDKLRECLEECVTEEKRFYIDEWSREEIESQLENLKSILSCCVCA